MTTRLDRIGGKTPKSRDGALTPGRLRELLNYDQHTGIFTWRISRTSHASEGAIAGCDNGQTYIKITIDQVHYLAHRLAWLYVYGEWPNHQIDHINGIKHDNRIVNLRDVQQAANLHNQHRAKRHNKLSTRGVSLHRGLYRAQISVNGKGMHVGYYRTLTDAKLAYEAAKASALAPLLEEV